MKRRAFIPSLLAAGSLLSVSNIAWSQTADLNGWINRAGRQRMLTQRMAVLYLRSSWGLDASASTGEIDKLKAEFLNVHQTLKSAPKSTTQLKTGLTLAESQFSFFDTALRGLQVGSVNTQKQADVFTPSERILEVMNHVTGLYAKLS